MAKVCPSCGSENVAPWNYIDSGDWRCIKDGIPLYLFIEPNN